MSLGFAPNLSLSASGGPSALAQLRGLLFANGEPGWIYDNTNPATMWQDLARTTPVTAQGQAVRIQNDLSGNGNHRSQPSSDASRPLWTTDANGRLGLRYDGTDDWLETGTITPGTDKVQVFAVWRKLSDAVVGSACEFSANYNINAGSFDFAIPGSATVQYRFRSRGVSSSQLEITSGYAAPITNIVTGLADISGDLATLRLNGAQVAQGTGDQGAGNYLAYPAYFGRRGGTSNPFNGHELGISICRFGPNLTLAQIQLVETLLNQAAGGGLL